MKMEIVIFALLIIIAEMFFVAATPEGPNTLQVDNSTRRTVNLYNTTAVLAGNVTQLTVTGSSVSQSWAGFYGNVTGTLSLESSNGKRMYTWSIPNPKGEIYATESGTIPTWGEPGVASSIACWNYTKMEDSYPSYDEVEGWGIFQAPEVIGTYAGKFTQKGMKQSAVDSINNTFKRTNGLTFPSFYSGTKYINGTSNKDECPSIALYNSTGDITFGGAGNLEPSAAAGSLAGGAYQEVILFDNTSKSILFTAIIDFERSVPGFDGKVWDFQMIVPEKGASGDTSTTPYNFYVELE